jgi:hypothetical protein
MKPVGFVRKTDDSGADCHSHKRGFGAPESTGCAVCRNCHGTTANAVVGSAARSPLSQDLVR